MSPLIRAAGPEIPYGTSEILRADDHPEVGMTLTTVKLRPGESPSFESDTCEMAVLVLSGTGTLFCGGRTLKFDRPSWLETNPTVVHAPSGVSIVAGNDGAARLYLIDPSEVWKQGCETLSASIRSEDDTREQWEQARAL